LFTQTVADERPRSPSLATFFEQSVAGDRRDDEQRIEMIVREMHATALAAHEAVEREQMD
jgi:hypothetical protein